MNIFINTSNYNYDFKIANSSKYSKSISADLKANRIFLGIYKTLNSYNKAENWINSTWNPGWQAKHFLIIRSCSWLQFYRKLLSQIIPAMFEDMQCVFPSVSPHSGLTTPCDFWRRALETVTRLQRQWDSVPSLFFIFSLVLNPPFCWFPTEFLLCFPPLPSCRVTSWKAGVLHISKQEESSQFLNTVLGFSIASPLELDLP